LKHEIKYNVSGFQNQIATLDLLIKMSLRLSIICIAVVLALVAPALADSTAKVHGEVYSSDSNSRFEQKHMRETVKYFYIS
jgi:hypothetical protein